MKRTILITGAGTGIGRDSAFALAMRGHSVLATTQTEEQARALREEAAQKNAVLQVFKLDITQDQDRQSIADLSLDVLINNAGVPKRKRTNEMTAEDVEGVMAINYFSPVRLTLAMLPHMLERDSGDIVNVSSMGVHMAAFGVSAYSASKAALEFFTEGLYVELGKTNVRAHLFVPGTTASEFSTDKPGNNAPFPSDPATTATSEEVAVSLLASLDTETFITYTGEREAQTSAKRNADVNAWLANMRQVFTGM